MVTTAISKKIQMFGLGDLGEYGGPSNLPSNDPGAPGQGSGEPKKPCFTFKNTGQCQYGDRCHYSHDLIPNAAGVGGGGGFGGPSFNGPKPCFEFMKNGSCRNGDTCPYSHDPASLVKSDKFCVAFQSGNCKFGAACRFKHETDPEFDPASAPPPGQGMPGGVGPKPCHAFQRGECTFGDRCRYSHVIAGAAGAGGNPMMGMDAIGGMFGNMPGQHPGMPGMQGISMGPMHPIIFAGHIRKDHSDDTDEEEEEEDEEEEEEEEDEEDMDEEGNKKKRMKKKKKKPEDVYDLYFNKKTYFLEGVHIVPKGINPPGIDVPFTGETDPQLETFTVEIFARNVDTGELVSILRTPVTGGIQWAPIVHPLNTIAVDYLAIQGDFRCLTVILHGGEVDHSQLPAKARDVVNSGVPVPEGWQDPEMDGKALEYSSDEDNVDEDVARGDRMVRQADPPSSVRQTMTQPILALHHALCVHSPTDNSQLLQTYFRAVGSPLPRNCRIDVESAAALVGKVFSLDDSKLSDSQQALMGTLDDVSMCLDETLLSVVSDEAFYSLPSDEARGKFDSFDNVFDEEAANTLVGYVVQSLDFLRLDDENGRVFDGQDPLRQGQVILDIGETVIRACESLMRNELTAEAFAGAEGMLVLASIANQSPRLPSVLQGRILELLCMGLRFHGCVTSFVEIPLFDSSGCQQLIESLKSVSRADEITAVAGVEALNFCHLSSALQRAGTYAKNTIDSLGEIAQSVTWHLSSLSTASGEEELPIVTGEKEDGPTLLAESVVKLEAVHTEMKHLVCTIQAALSAVSSDKSCVLSEKDASLALVKLLARSRLAAFLVVVAALASVSSDLVSLMEWGAPLDSSQVHALSSSCRTLFVDLVTQVLAIAGGEMVFAANPVEMELIWTFSSKDTHVFSSSSVDEMAGVPTTFTSLSSLGWSLKVIACVGNCIFPADGSKPPCDLHDFFAFPAGASVACRVSAVVVLPELLAKMSSLSRADQATISSTDLKAAERGTKLLTFCLASYDAATLAVMAPLYVKIAAIAGGFLSFDDANEHKRLKTTCLRISRVLAGICGEGTVPNSTAAITYLCKLASVDRENLSAVDLCLAITASSRSRLVTVALQPGASDVLATLTSTTIMVVRQTCNWIRAGSGWAEEASVSLAGYESLFGALAEPLPLTFDSKGRPEKLDTDNLIYRSKVLFQTLGSAIHLLHTILSTMLENGRIASHILKSQEIVDAVIYANAVARHLIGENKTTHLGALSRRVTSSCTKLLSLYCPPSPWSMEEAGGRTHGLVAYLFNKGIEESFTLAPNLELLSSLISMSHQACAGMEEAGVLQLENSLGVSTLTSEALNTSRTIRAAASFAGEVKESEESYPTVAVPEAVNAFTSFWTKQLHAQPIITAGKTLVPFSLLFDASGEFKETHDLQEPSLTSSEKREALPWADYACDDLLAETCDPALPLAACFVKRAFTLPEVLSAATLSASLELNESASALAVTSMSLSCESADKVACVLTDKILRLAIVNGSLSGAAIEKTRQGSKPGDKGGLDDVSAGILRANTDELCRCLLLVDALCSTPATAPFLAFVHNGLCEGAFACLQSTDQGVVTLALQVITTLYRRCASLCSVPPNALENGETEEILGGLETFLKDVAEALVEYLPGVCQQFQEEESTLVLAQVAILVQLFRLKHTKHFIDRLTSGTTIEYFTIKLWLGLEDSFQSLVEITEAFKNAGSEGIEDGEERLQAAFSAVSISAFALRAAVEMALLAYMRGWISLLTLTRAMRASLADPRKVSMQFQRAYTMWWTNDRLQVEKARLKSAFGTRKGGNIDDSSFGEAASTHLQPPLLAPRGLAYSEEGLSSHLEARNAMINTSFRRLVEAAVKVMEVNKGDKVERLSALDVFAPISAKESLHAWCGKGKVLGPSWESGATCTWTDGRDKAHMDALHLALRRVLILGGEKRGSVFDWPQRYIRLLALPAIMDPAAPERRRERRSKRKLELISAKKRELDAAKREKKAAEEERQKQEEQRLAMEALEAEASDMAARPTVALSGVPRAILGGNINSVPILDHGRQGVGMQLPSTNPPGAPGMIPNYGNGAGGPAPGGPPNNKHKPCFSLKNTGMCRHGDRCYYSHDPAVLGMIPPPPQQL